MTEAGAGMLNSLLLSSPPRPAWHKQGKNMGVASIGELARLSAWADQWFERSIIFCCGFDDQLKPVSDEELIRLATYSGDTFPQLARFGPQFCNAVDEWSSRIVAANRNAGLFRVPLGFVACRRDEYHAVPVVQKISGHAAAASLIDQIGGQIWEGWRDAVSQGVMIDRSDDGSERYIDLCSRLYLAPSGIDTLCETLRFEIAVIQGIQPESLSSAPDKKTPQKKSAKGKRANMSVEARAVAYVMQCRDPNLTYDQIAKATDSHPKYLMSRKMKMLKAAMAAVKNESSHKPRRGSKSDGVVEAIGDSDLEIDEIDRRDGR